MPEALPDVTRSPAEVSIRGQRKRGKFVVMKPDPAPALSVVICTYNRSTLLRKTVDQVMNQSLQEFELIIIDQSDIREAETNRANLQAMQDNRVNYIHIPRKGLPNARNEAIRRALAAIVLFLDDDVILLRDGFMAAHVAAYHDSRVGGVTGRHVERSVPINSRRTACHVSWSGRTIFNLFGTERVRIGTCKGSNMSFRAAIFADVGGFDRRAEMLEDADFSTRVTRAGWLLVFEPEAELVHLSTPSGGVRQRDALKAECRRFRSTSYYVLKHRGIIGFLPFFFTFMAIAATRVLRLRSVAALPILLNSIFQGVEKWRAGPDEKIEINDETVS
jgi:GT2 family glycosyltransferase